MLRQKCMYVNISGHICKLCSLSRFSQSMDKAFISIALFDAMSCGSCLTG